MKNKLRILSLLLCIALLSGILAGCSQSPENETGEKKIKVVCTIFPPYDFTRAIAGENVELTMLLSPGAEVHSYEPTPQDIIKVQSCDLFIYVGGESDSWVQDILGAVDASSMEIITLMDCVEPFVEETVEGMQSEEHEEHEEHEEEEAEGDTPEYDEHVWTSPRNALLITEKISEALCTAAPEMAETFRANAAAYEENLRALDQQFTELVAAAPRHTVIFADRFPLRYFTEAYGLSYYAAYPGCASESEPSAATVSFLIDKVKQEAIPTVFYIEFSNEMMADTIEEETGAEKLLFHSCHNVTRDDFASGVTYLQLMQQNLQNLKIALYS